MNSNTPMARRNTLRRPGGVYIAVLGTSMIVALLGLAALIGQRIQNQILVAAADTRQAQLNAFSAVELALASRAVAPAYGHAVGIARPAFEHPLRTGSAAEEAEQHRQARAV